MAKISLLILRCFVIVFCVDITVSQTTKNGKDLHKFLEKMGVKVESTGKLTKGELLYALGKAQSALTSADEKRYTLLAKIDFRETVKQFLKNCNPTWAPPRSQKEEETGYSEETLRLTLLNIENPKVAALKIELFKMNMSEDDFIKIVTEKLIPLRNENAYFELSDIEKEIGYSFLIQSSDYSSGVVLKRFLEYRQDKSSDIDLNHQILQEAKEKRQSYT